MGKKDWVNFKSDIDSVLPSTDASELFEKYRDEFENSNRTYFDLSAGFEVYACLPYSEIAGVDDNKSSLSDTAGLVNEIIIMTICKIQDK